MAHAPSSARSDLSVGRYAMWHIERVAFPLLHLYYYIFFSSHLSVLSKHTIGTGCFSPSHSLYHSFALCVFVYVPHARPFSVNEQQQPRHAGKTKKIYKKMRLDSNREFGVGGGGPETWRNSYFFCCFLSLCVCLAYALPPILSFL